jgi:ABC-type nickel/cobalt efflux system permease component RcnA
MRRAARRVLVLAAVTVASAIWPTAPAAAHPLGNFTVNVYGGVVVQSDAIVVDYVVDMAEIPAFRERRVIDVDLDDRVDAAESIAYRDETCASLPEGLTVHVDDEVVPIRSTGMHALAFLPGAAGLSTLRLECRLVGETEPIGEKAVISYADRTFPDSIGWHEVTMVGDGVTLTDADVPEASVSDRLTSYPKDEPPLDVRRATGSASPGGARLPALPAPGADVPGSSAIAGRDGGLLASLVGRDDLTPMLVAFMVVVALGVGALHALGPGHGKTLIGAYLVGSGGSLRHAVGVGAAVSVMHTASVLALGLLVLSAERVFAPERVYPVLGLGSGLIALGLGSALLVSRIHGATHSARGHRHTHAHAHPHPHGPTERLGEAGAMPLSRRGLTALAVSGGILPSPAALVVLLAAVSLGRTALGLALIGAFSLGLAAALIGVGVLTLRARDVAERRLSDRAARLMPVGSAAAIVAMGLFLTVRGVTQL